jgi:RimJ/RimL family protein N-acetyltransferase
VLTGKVVTLRAVEKEDAERVREWLSDPDLLHMLGARPIPLGSIDPEKLPEMFRMREGRVLAILSKDKTLIGLVAVGNFHEFNRTASIMVLIGDRAEWNRGYGSDAVRTVTAFGDCTPACCGGWTWPTSGRQVSRTALVTTMSQ